MQQGTDMEKRAGYSEFENEKGFGGGRPLELVQ